MFPLSVLLQRHSQIPRPPAPDSDGQSSCLTEVVGVLVQPKEPSSLSVKENMFHDGREAKVDATLAQKAQRTTGRKTKQEQLKRLHRAQVKERPLQPVRSAPGPGSGLTFRSVASDGPEETAAGGGEAETAGGARGDGGEAPERRTRSETHTHTAPVQALGGSCDPLL